MNDYIEARFDFEPCSSDITDLAAAFLADAGFESFLPDDRGLTAYIREADAAGVDYDEVFSGFPYEVSRTVTTKRIEGQDWNHEWEKNYFKPIIIFISKRTKGMHFQKQKKKERKSNCSLLVIECI